MMEMDHVYRCIDNSAMRPKEACTISDGCDRFGDEDADSLEIERMALK